MKYIICGFSGAGKSYILQHLREKPSLSSFTCIDLDHYLLENVAKSFDQLGKFISHVGWEEFRRQEKKAIYQLLGKNQVIISLGGGTLSEDLVNDLKSIHNCRGFWLNVDFEICWQRIKNDANRPLRLKGKEHLEKIFKERKKLYKEFQEVRSISDIYEAIMDDQLD